MNLKKKLRELLTEKDNKTTQTFDYGCIMIYLQVSDKDWTRLVNSIDEDDLYNGEDDNDRSYGREENPHVTVLYGIHSDVPDEDVEKLIDEVKPPKIELGKVSIFENSKFDVLKFEIDSPDLNKLNEKFKSLPYTSDFPDYKAHCTIAYLKKGMGKKYADKLNSKPTLIVKSDKVVYSKATDTGKSKKSYKLKK